MACDEVVQWVLVDWIKKGETSGKDYVRLALAAPEFGPRKLYASLGSAAGQDDNDIFALIWTPTD